MSGVFFQWRNVCGMLRRVRKGGWQEGRGAEPGLCQSAAADCANPSFISGKPSSAERRLADITELLTAHGLYTHSTRVRKAPPPPIQPASRRSRPSVQAGRTPLPLT